MMRSHYDAYQCRVWACTACMFLSACRSEIGWWGLGKCGGGGRRIICVSCYRTLCDEAKVSVNQTSLFQLKTQDCNLLFISKDSVLVRLSL